VDGRVECEFFCVLEGVGFIPTFLRMLECRGWFGSRKTDGGGLAAGVGRHGRGAGRRQRKPIENGAKGAARRLPARARRAIQLREVQTRQRPFLRLGFGGALPRRGGKGVDFWNDAEPARPEAKPYRRCRAIIFLEGGVWSNGELRG
jgi:hypothetical protein